MIVTFKGKDYADFERNPKIRSLWGEDIVRYFFESRGFRTYKTDEMTRNNLRIERPIKLFVDDLFKNKDFHSIDLFCIVESAEQRVDRKNDEKFVRNLMKKRIPYDLGKFNKERGYGLFIEFNTNKKGRIEQRRVYLIPTVLFIEVKTFLKGSKPPVISETELYKFIYFREEMGIGIVLFIIEIDIPNKKATVNLVLLEKWKGVKKTWLNIFTPAKVTLLDLPMYSQKPFPWKISKGEKMHAPVLLLDKKGQQVKVYGHTISYLCEIETKNALK